MTLEQFVTLHRRFIDGEIQRAGGNKPQDDEERALWVVNHEPLYLFAKQHVPGIDD